MLGRSDPVSAHAHQYVTERARRHEFTGQSPRVILSALRRFWQGVDDPPVSELTRDMIEAWLASEPDLSRSTARQRLSAVRGFCRWMVLHDIIPRDPTLGIQGAKEPRSVERALPAPSVAATFDVVPDRRGRLILSLAVQEMLRVSEIARLQCGDVDQINGTILVVGKGGHQRVVPLTDATRRAVNDYLSEFPLRAGPLIRSYQHPNRGVGSNYLSRLVSRWMYQAGIKTRPHDGVSCHALRHTGASDVVDKETDLRVVQQALGHTFLSTTQRYLRRVQVEKMREAMEGREYR